MYDWVLKKKGISVEDLPKKEEEPKPTPKEEKEEDRIK